MLPSPIESTCIELIGAVAAIEKKSWKANNLNEI